MECPAVFLLLVVLVTWRPAWCAEPSGDYVCSRLETYEVPMPTKVKRPYEIRYTEWCLKVPPRCPKTRTEFRDEIVMEMVSKSRVVRECCVGFEQREQLCVPRCSESCGSHGRCVAPDVCKCDPGFHGALCNYGYEIVIPPSIYDLPTSTSTSPSTTIVPSTTVTMSTTEILTQILTISTEKMQSETFTTTTSTFSTDESSTSSIEILTTATENSPSSVAQISKYITGNITISTGNDNESMSTPTSANPVDSFTPETDAESSISSPVTSDITTGVPITEHQFEVTSGANESQSHVSETTSLSTSETSILNTTESVHHGSTTFEAGYVTEANARHGPSVVVVTKTNTQNNETTHNYFLQNLDLVTTMTVIIGGSLTVLILALVIVLLCQHRRHNKTAPCNSADKQRDLETSMQEKPLPNIVHSQLPPTPRDFLAGHSGTLPHSNGGNNVLIVQHVCSMASSTNTFKPEPNQATISPALREALEAHYDHPPPSTLGRHSSARVSLSSSQRSPSLAALWDAVMSAAEQPAEEHLYDEIPCWNPRLYQRVPAYEEQTSRC